MMMYLRSNAIKTALLIFTSLLLFVCQGERLSTGQDVDSTVLDLISGADVMVFAKSYCPHCKQTRVLLHKLHDNDPDVGWTLDIIDLDLLGQDGPLIQMELMTQTRQRTVPNIFIGGKHIGGNSDLQALYAEGKLEDMLDNIAKSKHHHHQYRAQYA